MKTFVPETKGIVNMMNVNEVKIALIYTSVTSDQYVKIVGELT
jgi:hypothetical protein